MKANIFAVAVIFLSGWVVFWYTWERAMRPPMPPPPFEPFDAHLMAAWELPELESGFLISLKGPVAFGKFRKINGSDGLTVGYQWWSKYGMECPWHPRTAMWLEAEKR